MNMAMQDYLTLNKVTEQGLLSDLLERMRHDESGTGDFLPVPKELTDPLQYFSVGEQEDLFANLGIRSLVAEKLAEDFNIPNSPSLPGVRKDSSQSSWNDYKITSLLDILKDAFRRSQLIVFSDWAITQRASELWDGLRFDVIKPLARKDFNFVFHLGDPTRRLAFEVDEILDIISDFSMYGKVTLLLTELEAMKLWMVLHGEGGNVKTFSLGERSADEKYKSIYKAMNIDRLLVCGTDHALLMTGQQQFELTGKKFGNAKVSKEVKENFSAGYSLGLFLRLEISHCVALGLSASGAFLQKGVTPDRESLRSYMKQRLSDLSLQF